MLLKNLALLFVFIFVGCASSSGFNRGALREELSITPVVSDKEIQHILKLKPQLPKLFKIAIFFQEPTFKDFKQESRKWKWTESDKEEFVKFLSSEKIKNEVSQAIIINPAVVDGNDVKSLRLAAAQYGADALLVVSAVNEVDNYTNNWAWTYLALVTGAFVPGSVTDALFLSRAVMWDVRSQFMYLAIEAESLVTKKYPAFFRGGQIDAAILESKINSLSDLRKEFLKQFLIISKSKNKI